MPKWLLPLAVRQYEDYKGCGVGIFHPRLGSHRCRGHTACIVLCHFIKGLEHPVPVDPKGLQLSYGGVFFWGVGYQKFYINF